MPYLHAANTRSGVTAILLMFSSLAGAAPADEMVVTVDLLERTAADLPASITVLDTETIDSVALTHFEELTHLVPNLNFAGGSNRPRYFQIRGIGERSQYEGAPNPSVGFLIDDIDFSAIGGVALTWDIEQLEVLRGPQGTRYGANALAGLVNVRSAEPTDFWSGKARVSLGDDDAQSVGLAIGGPVNERVSFRVSAYSYEADGFRDNRFLGRDNTNGRDEAELRAKIRWVPNDAWQLDATVLYVDVDNGYDAFAIDNSFTTQSDKPGRDKQRSVAGAAKLRWEATDRFDFISLTTGADSDIFFGFDADWGNDQFWSPYTYDFISTRDRQRTTLSQEFRLISDADAGLFGNRLRWVLGAYALKLTEDLESVDQGLYVDPLFGPFAVDTQISSDYEAVNTALFTEVEFQLTDDTRVSAGIRFENRAAEYTDSNNLDLNPSESMTGGHVSVHHDLTDKLTGYAILSRGYKAGGFNLGQVPAGRREFDAEFVRNLEAGTTASLADGRIALRAAVFFARRDDQQVSTSFQINPSDPSSFVFFLDNAAESDDRGLELEASWQLTDNLSAYLNLGLLDTEIDLDTPQAMLQGRAQAHAPDYTFATGLNWAHASGLFARLDVSGKDAFYFSNSHNERSDSYELVHAKTGYRWDRWQLTVWGRNLTNEKYAVRGFLFGNEPPDFPDTRYVRLGDRRQVGLSLDWAF